MTLPNLLSTHFTRHFETATPWTIHHEQPSTTTTATRPPSAEASTAASLSSGPGPEAAVGASQRLEHVGRQQRHHHQTTPCRPAVHQPTQHCSCHDRSALCSRKLLATPASPVNRCSTAHDLSASTPANCPSIHPFAWPPALPRLLRALITAPIVHARFSDRCTSCHAPYAQPADRPQASKSTLAAHQRRCHSLRSSHSLSHRSQPSSLAILQH